MRSVCRTQFKRTAMMVSAVTLVSLIILLAGVWLLTRPVDIMEDNAVPGEPSALNEKYGYSQLMPQGFGLVRICATPPVEGKDIRLYLTNPAANPHLLRAEIYTAIPRTDASTGKITWEPGTFLGRTGFIQPGTYVESLTLNKSLSAGENKVIVKLAMRNAETGKSEGFVYLNMILLK